MKIVICVDDYFILLPNTWVIFFLGGNLLLVLSRCLLLRRQLLRKKLVFLKNFEGKFLGSKIAPWLEVKNYKKTNYQVKLN